MNTSTCSRGLVAALLVIMHGLPAAQAVNIAPEGTGIIGVLDGANAADPGTSFPHAGGVEAINDANPDTRVDTYGDGTLDYSYVGVEWTDARGDAVKSLVLTMATFFDGGWFGPNNSNPGGGGALTEAQLTEPIVQISSDFSVTWTSVPATSTYLSAFTGHQIGGGAVPNPSRRTATFTLTDPESGITGIRLIGPNGGPADGNGFIGVFELEVSALPANDLDNDGMADDWEAAHLLNPLVNDAALDADADGLPNGQEFTEDIDPQDPDSDDDGLNDGPEVLTALSDPKLQDTDADGLLDGPEVNTHHTSPTRPDTDGDGLTDPSELTTSLTNPTLADTDGDGFNDGMEIRLATDPLVASSRPNDIALLGTGIIGTNDAVDDDAGTPRANSGAATAINDGDFTTRVDTFGVPGDTMSFVGVLWPTPRTVAVDRVFFTMSVFFDGGWFGPNGSSPGTGNPLTSGDLTEPAVQVTSDGGTTWTTVAATSDYLTVFDGHLLPAVNFGAPTSATANFLLTTPQAGINGIRLIETNGGTADGNGFLGVFELEVRDISSAGDPDDDGLTNAQETTAGTNPNNPDTDGDGLKDGAEVNTHLTNPLVVDSDGDGFPDGSEVSQGTDPKSAASHLTDLARAGRAIMGTNEGVEETDAGTAYAQQGAAGILNINDGNLTTRVDTFGRTDAASFVGILWSAPLPDPVIRLELALATFGDGGWFGPNGVEPGPGNPLVAPDHLTEPVIQVTTDGGVTWAAAAATSDYLTEFTGHVIGGGPAGNPTSGTAVFILTTPQTGINGIRIIGEEGGTASGGFLGVFELAIPIVTAQDIDGDGLTTAQETTAGTDPNNPDTDGDGLLDGPEVNTHQTNPLARDTDGDLFSDGQEVALGTNPKSATSQPANLALAGQAIMGVNDALDGDAGTAYAQQGAPGMLNINDGNLATQVDTYNGGTVAPVSFVGIHWSAPLAVPVAQATLTLATFGDGGWFGPNNAGPGAGGALSAPGFLTEPTVQITVDGGVTWTTAAHTSDYLTAFAGHRIGGGGVPNPSSRSATFTLTSPQAGLHGMRIIGEEGGTASGGFVGVFELAVGSTPSAIDTDGDGQSDAEEAIAGTNPADPKDNLRITAVERVGNQVLLTWTSVPGKIYMTQSSESLTTWSPVQSGLSAAAAPATTTQTTIVLSGTPPAVLHFRVAVQP